MYVTPGPGYESDSNGRFTLIDDAGTVGTTRFDPGSGTWEVEFTMPSNQISVIGNFVASTTTTTEAPPAPNCATTDFFYDGAGVIYMQATYCGGGTYSAVDYSGNSYTLFDTQCIQSGTAVGTGTATEGASCA